MCLISAQCDSSLMNKWNLNKENYSPLFQLQIDLRQANLIPFAYLRHASQENKVGLPEKTP